MSYFRLNISPVQFDFFLLYLLLHSAAVASIYHNILRLFLTNSNSEHSIITCIHISIYISTYMRVCVCWQKLVDVRNAMHWNLISSCFIGKSTFFLFILLFSLLLSIAIAITVELHCIALCCVQWAVTLKIAFRFAYIILLSFRYPHLVSCSR